MPKDRGAILTTISASLTILDMRVDIIPAAALALLVLGAATVPAQSLADLSRQEEARRKAVQSSGKVYTNDSLRGEPPPAISPGAASAQPSTQPQAGSAPSPSQPASAEGASAAAAPAAGTPPAAAAGADNAPKTEADWRKRVADERDALSRAQIFAEALQTRINALSTDFVNRDDPAQREVVAADRQKALAELDRVKQEIQQHQKALGSVQDEARRAGVPAGWVR